MKGTIMGIICTREPDFRVTQSGQQMLKWSVAESFRDGQTKKTNFWECVLWGKRADSLNKVLRKGMEVVVVGEGNLNDYKNSQGEVRKRLEFKVDDVLIPRKEWEQKEAPKQEPEPEPEAPGPETFDDPIPF